MAKFLRILTCVGLMFSLPALAQNTAPTEDSEINVVDEGTDQSSQTQREEQPQDDEFINQVTMTDDQPTRRESEEFNFFRFGPSTLLNLGTGGTGIYLSGGKLFVTQPNAAIRASLDTSFNPAEEGTAIYFSANLGGNYYINNDLNYSPHIFADLGYGYGDGPTVDASHGFTLGVGGGASFFRTTDMQMDVSARYQLLMGPNDLGTPGILALVLGLNFG